MTHPKKTKPPASQKVYADDLVVVVDDKPYRPHSGEFVQIRGQMSWDFQLGVLKLQRLTGTNLELIDQAEIDSFEAVCSSLVDELAARIVAWDWTDLDGEPLGKPTAEVIGALGAEEIWWLFGAASGQYDRKNGSAPSTSP